MRILLNRPRATALVLTCTVLAWPLPSRAQFAPNPNQAYPAAKTQAKTAEKKIAMIETALAQ